MPVRTVLSLQCVVLRGIEIAAPRSASCLHRTCRKPCCRSRGRPGGARDRCSGLRLRLRRFRPG